MASDMEMCVNQRRVIEFLHAEKIAASDIHWCLLNICGDQTVDVSSVKQWVACFRSGDSDMKDKPCSGRPCTAVTPWNEERLNQLIHTNRWITTRELRTELNIGFNVLEIMVLFASIVVSVEIIGGITFGATLVSGSANVRGTIMPTCGFSTSGIWMICTKRLKTTMLPQHIRHNTSIDRPTSSRNMKISTATAQKLISWTLPMSSDYASSKDRTDTLHSYWPIRLHSVIIQKTTMWK
jgi:hypothetical protein